MFRISIMLCIAICALLAVSAGAKDNIIIMNPTQTITIIDGDTIKLDGDKIRLAGIDAPEKSQECYDHEGMEYQCGILALTYLADLLKTGTVECNIFGKDKYKRDLGECFVTETGVNVNSQMVFKGMAVAYGNTYIAEHLYAKTNHVGIWEGDFTFPKDWRHFKHKVTKRTVYN